MTPLSRVVDPLLQRALRMREDLGRTPEAHGAADVVPSRLAVLALLAGDTDLEGHLVSRGEVRDALANGHDGAAGLMTESERFLDGDVADGVVVEVVQVGAAETGGLDGDLDLAGWRSWELSLCLFE